MKIFDYLEEAYLEVLGSDPGGTITGRFWFNSGVGFLRYYNGGIKTVVSEDGVQTLTGKSLTDPVFTASGLFNHIATPANPAAGKVKLYAKSDDNLYVLNSSGEEVQVGSGSGGGLDTFVSEDFTKTQASDFSTGNNATFLGAGTATASPADETSSPIDGTRSIKYTQVSGSLNDYGALPAYTLDLKQKSNYMGVNFYATYDGNDDDINFVVYDVTNATVILDTPIKASASALRHSASFYVPSNATTLRIGYHVKVQNIGAILLLDSVELSSNPFTYKELVVTYSIFAQGNSGQSITANVTDIPFTEVSDSAGLFDGTSITVPRDNTIVNIAGSLFYNANQQIVAHLYLNGSHYKSLGYVGANDSQEFNYVGEFNAGDVLTIRDGGAGGTLSNATTAHYLSVVLQYTNSAVVTPATQTLMDWTQYTPSIVGFGTTSNESIFYRRVGGNLELVGTFQSGTPTATEAQIPLPLSLTVDSIFTSAKVVGQAGRNNASANTTKEFSVIATGGDTFVNLGMNEYASARSPLTPDNGDVFAAAGEVVYFYASIPIAEWDVKSYYLAALPFDSQVLDATGAGSFTAGQLNAKKVNNTVTISANTALTFSSASSAISATGFLPDWARPAANKSTVYKMDSTGIYLVTAYTDGRLEVELRDYSGTLTNFTSSGVQLTLSYNVD